MNIPQLFTSTGYLPPMVSYAQNFEDVTLRRALCDKATGVYIDVGAYHPVSDSVTHHFYLNGWSGVNVDANPTQFHLFEDMRPRDVNLCLAVGRAREVVPLYVIGDTGLTTTKRALAELHGDSYGPTRTIDVPMTTLQDIMEEHASSRTVDFLKVDVEGSEYEVLSSCDLSKHRPRIILFECSDVAAIHELLTAAEYMYAWFDGLNLYYVRNEDSHLVSLIARPPSLWDSIVQLQR